MSDFEYCGECGGWKGDVEPPTISTNPPPKKCGCE